MNIPGFTAGASLDRNTRSYAGSYRYGQSSNPQATRIVPAIPFCGNCDDILDRCSQNGWRPRAVCNACAVGDCYSGVEDPTPEDPFTPHPWQW